MNILIIHAHHEPRSFSSALKDQAVTTLGMLGHHVAVSDLYAMGFDPVSDRRNFTTVADPEHLKQQREELYATEHDGFAPTLSAEMEKVLRADLLIFNFPLWWFAMPAILKGWVDRVFAYGKVYGSGTLYENGIGRGKRALVTTTTGGGSGAYNGYGYNPSMSSILAPIHHGIFWFNGFAPLPPFVAYAVAHLTDDERVKLLDEYERYLTTLDELRPFVLPPLREFDGETSADRFGRWMLDVPNANTLNRVRISALQCEGTVVAFWWSRDGSPGRTAWILLRAESREDAEAIARTLLSGDASPFVIREAARLLPQELATV
jgi:NAD(P)H dehydrogenase (quinone)